MVSGDSSNSSSTGITSNDGNTGNIDRIDRIHTFHGNNNTRSQISGDSHKLQIFRQHASAVSHALWPSNLHRSAVLGNVSHQRKGHFLNDARPLKSPRLVGVTQVMPEYAPMLLGVTAVIVSISIVTALLLHRWFILLIPIFALTFATLLILQPFLDRMQGNIQGSGKPSIQQPQQTPQTFKSFPGIPTSLRRSFDTPMPRTPLVRELETYDLSQTNVEHFLDLPTKRDSKEHALEK